MAFCVMTNLINWTIKKFSPLAHAIDVRPYAARAVANADANAMDIACARIHTEEENQELDQFRNNQTPRIVVESGEKAI